jgi:hypothetical protein
MRKKLLFLGCNYDQVPYLEVLKNQNWEIIGADLNKNAPGKHLCDKFHNIGYDDFMGLINLGLKEKFSKNDMVFTAASQFAQKGAANFAAYFEIAFPSEKTIDLCLDKTAYYKYFLNNNIPIPKTWNIENKNELKDKIKTSDSEWFYLKSDFSKNPNYVYRFNKFDIPWNNFFWGKDRYLRKYYVLQEEAKGISLRINLFGDRFNVFDFLTGEKTKIHHESIISLNIIETLKQFINNQGMQNWLIKFDIILGKNTYVVLDIGMDPPIRMLRESEKNDVSFPEHYINQYLNNKVTYPEILD